MWSRIACSTFRKGVCVIAKNHKRPRKRMIAGIAPISIIIDELAAPRVIPKSKRRDAQRTKFAPGDKVIMDPRFMANTIDDIPTDDAGVQPMFGITEEDLCVYVDLKRLMPTLTGRQRELFLALFEHNLSIEAVSQEFSLDESTVRQSRDEIAQKLRSVR